MWKWSKTPLGVTIDFQLNFNVHISEICRKASRQLNVLKRIGKYLTRLGKLTIYHSFIVSNFNYCPLSWHFCGEGNLIKLEKIQERALRFVYDDHTSSYEILIQRSKLPELHVRRLRTMALETYKILNKQGPTYLHDLVSLKNSEYSFRYTNIVNIPRPRTTRYGLKSFRYAAAKLWNELPDNFRLASSFECFKTLIDAWHGSICKCAACK